MSIKEGWLSYIFFFSLTSFLFNSSQESHKYIHKVQTRGWFYGGYSDHGWQQS